MTRQTAAAILTNFNGSYILLPFLALFTLIAFVAPIDRVAPYNLLMSLGLVAAAFVGVLAGTTLTEIKVKPLSYVLPGQEKSMAPAVLLVGVLVSLVYALLLLEHPMTVVTLPAFEQSLAVSASAWVSSCSSSRFASSLTTRHSRRWPASYRSFSSCRPCGRNGSRLHGSL